MSYLEEYEKRPREIRDLSFDVAKDLTSGETIATVNVIGDASVLSGAATFSGSVVSQKVTGGKDGQDYRLSYEVGTSASNRIEASIILKIRVRPKK